MCIWSLNPPSLSTSPEPANLLLSLLQRYLYRYGYLEGSGHLAGQVTLDEALKKMQRRLSLPETGQLDGPTLSAIRAPRCGVPDFGHFQTFQGDLKWDHKDITYR
uniref:Peptidoglycan binding-like domain-containing protein n=1 Tax=Anolis carolinensis TaxID=28377 RepID=H9G3K2_ANOCA